MKNKYNQGFTLIEMSIVILIIGVIIGGIMLGQSLVTSSKLQLVITDADNYANAAANFKQTYQGLPGDFSNAATVWGTDSNGCTNGGGASGTCSGDGDGMIESAAAASQVGEMFLFWQHLAKAEMFNNALQNKAGSAGGSDSLIDTNVPMGSIKGSGFSVTWLGTLSGNSNYFDGSYANAIIFGGRTSASVSNTVILTSEQAEAIDSKIDDALPGTGKIRPFKNGGTINATCASSATAYNLTASSRLCSLIFIYGF